MKARVIVLALVLLGTALMPLAASDGVFDCERTMPRAEPTITDNGLHQKEATWDMSDPAIYNKTNIVFSTGRVNLTQTLGPTKGSWSALASVSPTMERDGHAMAWDDANNQVILHSGHYDDGMSWYPENYQNMFTYDPATNLWTDKGVPKNPTESSAVWDTRDKRLITYGGNDTSQMTGIVYHNAIWAWNPTGGVWSYRTEGPGARAGHAAVWDPADNLMLVFGGHNNESYMNDLWSYDYTSNTWTNLTPSGNGPSARAYHSAVWDPSTRQMVICGGIASSQAKNDLWFYNHTTNTWSQKANAPVSRYGHAACWNPETNAMLIVAGRAGSQYFNDSYAYNPVLDSWFTDTRLPAKPRGLTAAVFDPVRSQVILNGGLDSATKQFTDTWAYRGGSLQMQYFTWGSLQSPVLDLGSKVYSLDKALWFGQIPVGTSIVFKLRSGASASQLSDFVETGNNTKPYKSGQFVQWNVTLLASFNHLQTPELYGVRLQYSVNSKPVVTAGPDVQTTKRSPVVMKGTAMDTDGDGLVMTWTQLAGPLAFLNTSAGAGEAAFTPTTSGLYIFSFSAKDQYGESDPALVNVSVPNRVPVANAGSDLYRIKGIAMTVTGSGTDEDGDALSYRWTQTGGTSLGLTSFNLPSLGFTPTLLGNYTFSLIVSDGEMLSAPSIVTVHIEGRLPVAVLEASPRNISLNQSVTFNVARSTDGDGRVVQYLLDFGDGSNSTLMGSQAVNHTYARPGNFSAVLTVKDDDGFLSNASAPVRITVTNRVPFASPVAAPYSGDLTTTFRFTAPVCTTYDPDGSIVSYLWDFGDGTTGTGQLVTHIYKLKGTFEVRLRVTDDYGAVAESGLNVSVVNRKPYIVSFAPMPPVTIREGQSLNFSVAAVDPDGDQLWYTWKVNGTVQGGNQSAFVLGPQKKGEYNVNVSIDEGGYIIFAEWHVFVEPKPVTITPKAGMEQYAIPLALIIVMAAMVTLVIVARRRSYASSDSTFQEPEVEAPSQVTPQKTVEPPTARPPATETNTQPPAAPPEPSAEAAPPVAEKAAEAPASVEEKVAEPPASGTDKAGAAAAAPETGTDKTVMK